MLVSAGWSRVARWVLFGWTLAATPALLLLAASSRVRLAAIEVIAERFHPRAVFVGDSLTAQGGAWAWRLGWQPFAARNLGRGGFTSSQIRGVLPQALVARPAWIALCAGANDVASAHYCEQETVENLRAMIDAAHAAGCRVVLTLVPQRATHFAQTDALNTRLRALPVDALIDLNPTLAPEGILLPRYTIDGTHLSEAALAVWVAELRRAIR